MLLTRWIETLANFRDRPAVFDGERVLLFADLADALAALPVVHGPVIARGSAFEIAVASLHGWRDGQIVVPVERRESPPETLCFQDLGIAHLKRVPSSNNEPRFVGFSAEQLTDDADRIVSAMELNADSPNLAAVSLAHSYGYSSIILPMLLHGIPIQTVEVPFPAVVATAMKPHKRLTVPAVPSMWRAWHRSGILKNSPITLALSAGAPLALDLEQSVWETDGLKLHNFYGASECGGISWDPSETPRQHADSLGIALPGVDIQLDESRHFVVRSSSVGFGCYPACSSDPIIDGVFQTPDAGHLENDILILDARGGEHINVAGRKLGPGRIENTILTTGLVDQVRIFGIPSNDPERVDEVAALIPHGTDSKALRDAIGNQLAGWQMPRHWFTAEDDSTWSLSRAELRERFEL